MRIVLLFSGAISFIFGAVLLFVPVVVKRLSEICNQVMLDFDGWVRKFADICDKILLDVDAKIHSSRIASGILFVVLSVVMLYFAAKK